MAYTFVREPLNSEECDRLVNACRTFREKMVIWTLLDTGMRVSEFCNLRGKQFQWQENSIVVWGKGGRYGTRKKRRIILLTVRVYQIFKIYFITNDIVRISVRATQRQVKKVANRAMITKPVTPHVLRHSFAVNCVKRGLSMASLRKDFGP